MAQSLGKRLTCPLCRDSSFYSFVELEAHGGRVYCDNHPNWIEMVDLAELMEIYGLQVVVVEDEVEMGGDYAVEIDQGRVSGDISRVP